MWQRGYKHGRGVNSIDFLGAIKAYAWYLRNWKHFCRIANLELHGKHFWKVSIYSWYKAIIIDNQSHHNHFSVIKSEIHRMNCYLLSWTKTCWDKLGHHVFLFFFTIFLLLPANFFKKMFLPRSPLAMLSIRDLTLHRRPKTTLKGRCVYVGGRGGGANISAMCKFC